MGRLDNFEDRLEQAMDGAAGTVFKSTLNPVQVMRRAEKEMGREKLVSAGKQYAPTLYNVLVNAEDDQKLAGFYPTMASEIEAALKSKALSDGLQMDGAPLVRFIADDGLKRGKFDVIAENVAAPIVAQLREEEMERYGLAGNAQSAQNQRPAREPYARAPQQPLREQPYVDEFNQGGYAQEPYQNEYPAQETPGAYDEVYAPLPAVQGTADQYAQPGSGMAGAAVGYNRVPRTVNFQSPAAELVDTATGKRYALSGLRLSLGRERNNSIAIRDANVSRSHAELVSEGGAWMLHDLGSTNGTQVNGRDVSECRLNDGDRITVGMTTLEFREG